MLIVALVLALIGLGALVMAVVTSNELIAWVCIVASVIGVVLLIVDALRDRSKGDAGESSSATEEADDIESDYVEDYPDEAPVADQYDDTQYGDTQNGDTQHDDTIDVDGEHRDEQSVHTRTGDEEPPKS